MLTNWDKLKRWWDDWKPAVKTFASSVLQSIGSGGTVPITARASGDKNFQGGLTYLHDEFQGAYEIYDLPKGTRIYNHDASEDLVKTTAAEVAKGMMNRSGNNSSSSIGDIYLSNNTYLDGKLINSETNKIQGSQYKKASRNRGLK
jgi:hypothetical protein